MFLPGSPHGRLAGHDLHPRPVAALYTSASRDHDEELIHGGRVTADLTAGLDMQHGDRAAVTPHHCPGENADTAVRMHRPARRPPEVQDFHGVRRYAPPKAS